MFLKCSTRKKIGKGVSPCARPANAEGFIREWRELTRMKKGRYSKALLLWDHHGSGRDHKQSPDQVAQEIQAKLDSFTWSANSATTVLVPELEQWLWFCESAVAVHCGVSALQLRQWVEERSIKLSRTVDALKQMQPKELFEHIMRERVNRTISPRDFEEIGQRASVNALLACGSFSALVQTLRAWFP